jgi:hypothetical protein
MSGEPAHPTPRRDDRVQRWWRPALGWVGVLAFLYATLLMHVFNFALTILSVWRGVPIPLLQTPDLTLMLEVLAMVLGLGYLRTSEKLNGASSIERP